MIDFPLWNRLLVEEWNGVIEKADPNLVSTLFLFVFGPRALEAHPYKNLQTRVSVLNAIHTKDAAALVQWVADRSGITSTERPDQALKKEKWLVGAVFYPFPSQQTLFVSNRHLGILKHADNLKRGVHLLYNFVDEAARKLTPEQNCLLLRTLVVHAGVREGEHTISFWQLLVDWAHRDPNRLGVYQELVGRFQKVLGSLSRPTLKREDFRSGELFSSYIKRRVLGSLGIPLSEAASAFITDQMKYSIEILLDIAYFAASPPADLPTNRGSREIVRSLHYFKQLNTQSTSLFELIVLRDPKLATEAPYSALELTNISEASAALALTQKLIPRFSHLNRGEHFYLFLFCLKHSEEPFSDLAIEEVTLKELLLWAGDSFSARLRAYRNYESSGQPLIPGCTFSEAQERFLHVCPDAVSVLRSYFETLGIPADPDFCFHFSMYGIRGAIQSSDLLEMQQEMYALSMPLPAALRPMLNTPFPYQQTPAGQRDLPICEETENALRRGVRVLFSDQPNSGEGVRRVLTHHAALIEEGRPVFYCDAHNQWPGKDQSFQDYLIERTLASLEARLELTFSEMVAGILKEEMETETVRLDLGYFPHFDPPYTLDRQRTSYPLLMHLQHFFRLRTCCHTPPERSLLLDYLFSCEEIYTNKEPHRGFLPEALPDVLAPMQDVLPVMSALASRLPNMSIEFLVGVCLKKPQLMEILPGWPLESLTLKQLLVVCAQEHRIQRCQKSHPDFGLGFSPEQRGFLHALSNEPAFQQRLRFVRQLPRGGTRPFAFAFLMSEIELEEADQQEILAALRLQGFAQAVKIFGSKLLYDNNLDVMELFIQRFGKND